MKPMAILPDSQREVTLPPQVIRKSNKKMTLLSTLLMSLRSNKSRVKHVITQDKSADKKSGGRVVSVHREAQRSETVT